MEVPNVVSTTDEGGATTTVTLDARSLPVEVKEPYNSYRFNSARWDNLPAATTWVSGTTTPA